MTTMIIEIADAMPATNYTIKPTKELYNFADQIGYTTGGR